jgi:hypothetical protein
MPMVMDGHSGREIGCRSLKIGGHRFGMLVAERPIQCDRSRYLYWLCECDCGWSCVRRGVDLVKQGDTANCGCVNGWLPAYIKNLTGQRFGKLTAQEFSHTRKQTAYWKCVCDCGKEVVRRTVDLTTGLAMSCGCSRVVSADAVGRHYTIYNQYRCGAMSRGLEFTLTRDEVSELVRSPCHYCGQEPSPIVGIDRVDNLRGYVAGNVVPCCRKCNRAKDVYSQSEFMHWIKRAYEHMSLWSLEADEVRSPQSIARDDFAWSRVHAMAEIPDAA